MNKWYLIHRFLRITLVVILITVANNFYSITYYRVFVASCPLPSL